MVEVLKDEFLVTGDSFDNFLAHLTTLLQRYKECNLVPNLEKYYYTVKKRYFLRNKISIKGIEVDKPKIEII